LTGGERSNGAPYARELRVLALAAVGAAALGLAALGVAGRLTDRLLLDFRGFAPSASRPEVLALFGPAQGVPEQRPLRLALQLAEPVRPGDFVAAERTFELAPGRYCLRALTFTGPVPRGTPPLAHPLEARVLIDGAIADARVVRDQADGEPGGMVFLEGLQPRAGRLTVRFELRAYDGGAWLHPRAPAVHFETATLRRCPQAKGER
jgi:hypothetical protein